MTASELVGNEVLATLSAQAGRADAEGVWPEASWLGLRRAGVLGWCVSREYGGQNRGPVEILEGYESLASAGGGPGRNWLARSSAKGVT